MKQHIKHLSILAVSGLLFACSTTKNNQKKAEINLPESYSGFEQSASESLDGDILTWVSFFDDPILIQYIETALQENQEIQMMLQEVNISAFEISARKGEYLPAVGLGVGSRIEKEGRYTRFGAVDDQLTIKDNRPFPEPFGDHLMVAQAQWEVDIWKRLRNAKGASVARYMATVEGKHLLTTSLVSEIASRYYELLALDNTLKIIDQNIEIQQSALEAVTQLKNAAKVSQLAVNRFEAQLLNTKGRAFEIRQRIIETENDLRLLIGNSELEINRNNSDFEKIELKELETGVPSQLLHNRPDIKQAEFIVQANSLDVKVAQANFYPNLTIRANAGLQAFNPAFLINPESIMYNLAGDLMAPLINRKAITALYETSKASQVQAVYAYEQRVLQAYIDVVNQLNQIQNAELSLATKQEEVDIMIQSIRAANNLFKAARADYSEVLLTQREALEAKLDLIEIKQTQLQAKVQLYRALGGGWN
jgi:NodT family efflux transporter outer membrane factor (OMF) lipoprotein